jgi:hypothetical protein
MDLRKNPLTKIKILPKDPLRKERLASKTMGSKPGKHLRRERESPSMKKLPRDILFLSTFQLITPQGSSPRLLEEFGYWIAITW